MISTWQFTYIGHFFRFDTSKSNQTLFGLRKIVGTVNFRRLTIFHPTVARWLLWKSSAQRMADMFTSVCPSVCLFIYPTVYLSVHDGSQLKEASNWSFLRPFCVLMMTMMMTLYSRVWNKRNPWNKRYPALIYIWAKKSPPKWMNVALRLFNEVYSGLESRTPTLMMILVPREVVKVVEQV